jgi:hypothetical protein
MYEIQSSINLKEWDEIDLSTPELRQKSIEILMRQKTQRGEDISQCLQVLEYLKNENVEKKLQDIFIHRVKQKLIFDSWRKVGKTSLVILVVITCYAGLFTFLNSFRATNSLLQLSGQREQSKVILRPGINNSNSLHKRRK